MTKAKIEKNDLNLTQLSPEELILSALEDKKAALQVALKAASLKKEKDDSDELFWSAQDICRLHAEIGDLKLRLLEKQEEKQPLERRIKKFLISSLRGNLGFGVEFLLVGMRVGIRTVGLCVLIGFIAILCGIDIKTALEAQSWAQTPEEGVQFIVGSLWRMIVELFRIIVPFF